MDTMKFGAVLGTAVTTFLVVGAATIEIVSAATGADIGPGIVGVFVGVLASLLAAMLVQWRWSMLPHWARSTLLGYGVFGIAIVGLAFLSYVNTPGVDELLNLYRNIIIAAVIALIVAVGSGGFRRSITTD